MKKAKKLTIGISLSIILGSTAIAVGVNLFNSSLTNNLSTDINDSKIKNSESNIRTSSHDVDWANHRIDGVQLQLSDGLLYEKDDFWRIYSNVDSTSKKFSSGVPSYFIVEVNKSSKNYKDIYKHFKADSPFVIIDSDQQNLRFALMIENPTPDYNEDIRIIIYDKVDANGNSIWGESKGYFAYIKYNVGGPELKEVTITGSKSSFYRGETIELQSNIKFNKEPYTPIASDLHYEWYWVINNVEKKIDGQTTSNLITTMPKVDEGSTIQIKCKATYQKITKEASYSITFNKQIISKLKINSEDVVGINYSVTVGQTISLDSSYEINGGTKPPKSEIEYTWYFLKNGVKIAITDKNDSSLSYNPVIADNESFIFLEMNWNGQKLESNQIRLLVSEPPANPVISNVQIDGKNVYWDDESISLTATPTFTPNTTNGDGEVTYQWIQMLDGERKELSGQTKPELNIPVPNVDNDSELSYICKATYKGKPKSSAQYKVTIKKRKLTNLIISNNESSSSFVEVKENESISLSSSYDVDHGVRPTTGIAYQWYLRDKNGIEDIIPNQTSSTLNWTPTIYDSGKSILLKATWNGTTISSNVIYLVVNSNNSNNQDGSNNNQSVETSGMPSYIWYIVAGVAVVLIIVVIVIILMKKKKAEQQKLAASKRMNVARPNPPRLSGANSLAHSRPQGPRPMNGPAGPNSRPRPQAPAPMGPGTRPGMPQAKPSGPPPPTPRPGAGAQRPGMQKPAPPPPPKVEINAPPKSLAPKKK